MDYLPVFLRGERRSLPLVVGGGAVAPRKVELLLKAQRARARGRPASLHAELALYRDAGASQHHVPLPFEPQHLRRRDRSRSRPPIAPRSIRRSPRPRAPRGIFVNVVDDAAASTFIMPAIVDRSPVIVAIELRRHTPRRWRGACARRSRRCCRSASASWRACRAAARARAAGAAGHRARRRFWERLLAAQSPPRCSPADERGRRGAAAMPSCALAADVGRWQRPRRARSI